MSSNSIKAPPALSKCQSYNSWLKELEIWQAFTDIPPEKQGPAIFLTLEDKAREAVLELDVGNIKDTNGVKNIIEKLDSLYKKDEAQVAYEAYDNFERFQRPSSMSIKDYIIEFERRLSKTKSLGTNMSEDILAYRVLKSANISEHHQQLARATLSKFDYESMKKQLNKIFGDSPDMGECVAQSVKVENINECELSQDAYYYKSPSVTNCYQSTEKY